MRTETETEPKRDAPAAPPEAEPESRDGHGWGSAGALSGESCSSC
jgi:hypothetical protein